jgi:hypothetical protein
VGEVSYKGHRYPAEIIAHCVWLYHRLPLSFREVEELMGVRGVIVTYETIRPALVFRGTAAAVSRSGGCLVALLGAVDGGASDTEQVGQFGGAVLTGLEQADQMCFLSGVELGLLAAEPTLGHRQLHSFSGAEPDQVGLELRDHGQRVEQQPAHRVVRVIDRDAETQTDLPGGEFVGDRPRVGQRPARRSSLVTTRVSPSRQAAIASRRPGRSRVVPVRP